MKRLIAELVLLAVGVLFIVDALFLNLISFDYGSIGLSWLDPMFSHLYWGIALIIIAIYDLYRK